MAVSLEEVTPSPCTFSGCCTTAASPDSAETSAVRTQPKPCINGAEKLHWFALLSIVLGLRDDVLSKQCHRMLFIFESLLLNKF